MNQIPFMFFGWVGLFLIIIYFISYIIIAAIKDSNNETIFVFGLGEYPIYLSEKHFYRKSLSDKYKKYKQKK